METRYYQSPDLDIERITRDLERIYLTQDYQVQHMGDQEQMIVQVRQGSELEAVIGMQAALTLTLQRFPRGIVAAVGQQQWISKAAAGALGVLFLWPLAVTAGVGVIRQATLESQLFSTLDTVVLQQRPNVIIGPVPPDIAAQTQQRSSSAPSMTCPHCHTINDTGDRYCSQCGRALTVEKRRCPTCQAEVKPSAAFCTNCGTSLARATP